jgi:hypothetical protein
MRLHQPHSRTGKIGLLLSKCHEVEQRMIAAVIAYYARFLEVGKVNLPQRTYKYQDSCLQRPTSSNL